MWCNFFFLCVLTSYPDATPEELQQGDNVCIICREEMTTGCKKLPCNHIFHTSCLRSWFQRQQTCPTCRMDVLRPQPPPQPQQPPPPQAPQPPFGFHPMGVPPPPMGIPPTPGVPPQGLQNGKNLLEMRLICACKNLMVVFCKTCILLPLTDFFVVVIFLFAWCLQHILDWAPKLQELYWLNHTDRLWKPASHQSLYLFQSSSEKWNMYIHGASIKSFPINCSSSLSFHFLNSSLINPSTPKIWLLILLSFCYIFICKLVMRIWC